ncbi:hypothetical protein G6O69_15405 [Pseudenhygromyxa sp. WMMC2535]|uniref:hypothetical protein n=1 Tax=Pseudenhygromyxa sp. WMMC2535 TaxID=2712867 RepID=UPI001554A7DB|nr:hypothetical protein [Pseudenhygromyxa sp. WMMC2535]NVB39229.1 hypothetical protein [Pseudenhygromyxa sp. WMMC2535]
MIVRPYPGLIALDEGETSSTLRLDAASGWEMRWQPLDEWKRQVDVIEVSALSPRVCEALGCERPAAQLGEGLSWARRLLSAARLVVVREHDRAQLLELGVRVYTIGYHRVPERLRIIAVGGGEPTLWIEQSLPSFWDPNPRATALVSEPVRGPDAELETLELLEQILSAATEGVIDGRCFALALGIHHECGTDFSLSRSEREARRESVESLRPLVEPGDDDSDWARQLLNDERYPLARALNEWEAGMRRRYDDEPSAALLANAQALRAGQPEQVCVVTGAQGKEGLYRRERSSASRLVRLRPSFEGWFGDPATLWGSAPPVPDEGYLRVPASHRYVLRRAPR